MRHAVEVQGSQVALPMETSFVLHTRSNKPLVAVRFDTDSERIVLSREKATIARKTVAGDLGPEQQLPAASEPFLSSSGLDAAVPFVLSAKATAKKVEPGKSENDKSVSANDKATSPTAGLPGAIPAATKTAAAKEPPAPAPLVGLPIPIPADCRMRLELEDTDGITSIEPIRVVINGIVDQPPVIQSELRGIGSSITRKAVIPVSGTITDDYGVARARFEYRVRNEKDWQPRAFRRPPSGSPKTHGASRLRNRKFGTVRGAAAGFEARREVEPFRLRGRRRQFERPSRQPQRGIRLSNRDERRAAVAGLFERGESPRTVRKDHFRAGKSAKRSDRSSRRAADKARLDSARGKAAPSVSPVAAKDDAGRRDADDAGDLQTAIAICAVRSLHQVQKNSVETASVEDSFRGLLDELVNNGVHTQQMVDRIGSRIVGPLHQANERDFPAADEAIGLFKLAVDENRDPLPQIDASVRSVATVIARLKTALGEMQDLVKFHEAIGQLQGMIKEQEQIIDSTRQEQKRKRLQELKGLELLK